METKVITWDFKKPDKLEVHPGMGLPAIQALRDAFVRQYRTEIYNWLQPYFDDGWRTRWDIDGSILITEGQTKTNWLVAATEIALGATGYRGVNSIHTYMIVKGYSVELIR